MKWKLLKILKNLFFCCDYWYEIVQAFFMFNKYFHNSKSEYYHAHVAYQFIPILICCFFVFVKYTFVSLPSIPLQWMEMKQKMYFFFLLGQLTEACVWMSNKILILCFSLLVDEWSVQWLFWWFFPIIIKVIY